MEVGSSDTTAISDFDKQGGDVYHTMILGTTGRGKSGLLQAEAVRLGIAYDELLKQMAQAPERQEAARMRQEQHRQKDEARLNAVREAFWAGTDEEDPELHILHDALTIAGLVEKPTSEQVNALFMMLPETVIGQGISWGFNDTEVREAVHEFVTKNRDMVFQRMKKVEL